MWTQDHREPVEQAGSTPTSPAVAAAAERTHAAETDEIDPAAAEQLMQQLDLLDQKLRQYTQTQVSPREAAAAVEPPEPTGLDTAAPAH